MSFCLRRTLGVKFTIVSAHLAQRSERSIDDNESGYTDRLAQRDVLLTYLLSVNMRFARRHRYTQNQEKALIKALRYGRETLSSRMPTILPEEEGGVVGKYIKLCEEAVPQRKLTL